MHTPMSFTTAVLALFSLSRSSFASPSCSKLKATTINATFDELDPPTRVGVLNAMPVPYQHINWKYLEFANLTPPVKNIPGASLSPNTLPIIIATSIVLEDVTRNIPTMSVNYPGSDVKHFDLHSMYICCIVLGVDNSGKDCFMTFTGHKVGGGTVTQDCTYKGAKANKMDYCEFEGFTGLKKVVMAPGGGLPGSGDTVFDTVVYTIYQ